MTVFCMMEYFNMHSISQCMLYRKRFLHDFLVILKHSLQKSLKKCFVGTRWIVIYLQQIQQYTSMLSGAERFNTFNMFTPSKRVLWIWYFEHSAYSTEKICLYIFEKKIQAVVAWEFRKNLEEMFLQTWTYCYVLNRLESWNHTLVWCLSLYC